FHVLEEPGDLGRGEVGIEQQAGLGGDGALVALRLERAAPVGGAAVLPDDRAVDGPAGAPVPDDAGLALVGDAEGGDIARLEPRSGEGLAGGLQSRAPDVLRIVLHPAGSRIVLGELALGEAQNAQVFGEDQGTTGSGT